MVIIRRNCARSFFAGCCRGDSDEDGQGLCRTGGGLSRIVYLLSDAGSLADSELNACFDALSDGMKRALGEPDSRTAAVAAWELEDCTVQIGTGRFKRNSGSDEPSVAIAFKPVKAEAPAPAPRVSR